MGNQDQRRAMLRALAALGLASGMPAVHGHSPRYPSRPITLICGLGAGGLVDELMRVIALGASKHLMQPVVVENRPGAGGILGAEYVGRMPSGDGHTLIQSSVTMVRLPFMRKTNFDPVADITWIISLVSVPFVIAVRSDSPYRTLKDLFDDARAKPGGLSYGSAGVGTGNHILGEILASELGTPLLHVPYKGGAENLNALLAGHTNFAIETGGAFPLADAGRVRLLAVFEAERMARAPDVPTAAELGHKLVYNSPLGIAGPKNMPEGVVKTVHDTVLDVTRSPAYEATLRKYDLAPAYRNTADYTAWARESAAYEKSWIKKLGLDAKS